MKVISPKAWKRPLCSDFVGSVVCLVLRGKEGRILKRRCNELERVSGDKGREFVLRVMRKRGRRIKEREEEMKRPATICLLYCLYRSG